MHDNINTATSYINRKVKKMKNGAWHDELEYLVQEKAITIYVNSTELSTIICSPWNLKEMAVGFLYSEGILRERSKLKELTIDEDKGLVYAEIEGFEEDLSGKMFLKRYITPCCGRGRASFYYSSDAMICKLVEENIKISSDQVIGLMEELENKSTTFHSTGGVHTAGLADKDGIFILTEDVGRHNTLDKICGKCFLDEIPMDDKVLVFSGRVSSEILLKVVKMKISIIISRSAPTELALDLAEDLGVTVIGFTRNKSFTVYTHFDKIV